MTLLLRRAYVGSVTSETHFSVHIHFSMLTENCSRVTLKCLETTTESMYWVSPNKIVFENIWPQMIIVPFLCLLRYEIPSSIFVEVLLAILSYKLQCYGSTGVSMNWFEHYDDVIMSAIASQITSLTIVYSTVYSGADQRKHQSVTGLCVGNSPGPVNSPHKGPVTWKMFPFDDVIMEIVPAQWYGHLLSIMYFWSHCHW